jgi:hypothetical protein
MRRAALIALIVLAIVIGSIIYIKTARNCAGPPRQRVASAQTIAGLQNGDIIFQASHSSQSKAIQLATHSKYSHCGLLFRHNGDWQVLEAVQPVKWTPLAQWIARGEGGHYVVKRVSAAAPMPDELFLRLKAKAQELVGKDYDSYFGWGDDRIYCSELVWKSYRVITGLELGRLQQLGDFDLSSAAVKKTLSARYGPNIPLKEKVISPVAIFNSDLLRTVQER